MTLEMVKLRNGAEAQRVAVNILMFTLRDLLRTRPVDFYELVMKARDGSHKFFGECGEYLKNLSLVEHDGSLHDTVKNIILSAVEGEGLKMTLRSPILEESASAAPTRSEAATEEKENG